MHFTRCQARYLVRLTGLVLAGCVPSGAREGVHPVELLLVARGASVAQGSLPDSETVSRALPTGPMALDTAVRIALLHSPHMRVVLSDVGLAQADLWQASRIPNPVLDLIRGFPLSGGVGISNVGIGYSIVAALQTPLRRKIAVGALVAAEQQVADAVYGTMIDVQRAYRDVQYQQQNVELQRTVTAAMAASTIVAKALREAGNVPELTLVSEQAMSAQSEAELAEAETDLATARAELGRRLGATVGDTLWTIAGRLSEPQPRVLTLVRIDSMALERRLDVSAARDRARAAATALNLDSRFRLLHDGTLGAFWERDPDGRYAGPTVSVPLPLFNGGGASVAKARAVLQQRTAQYDALVVDVHAEVRAALGKLSGAERRATQMRMVVLPARRRVLQETQLQVNAMTLPVFALLQAKQSEIEAGRMYLRTLRDYWMAHAELERASGGVLPTGNM